jgi:hypothetical protein
MINNKKISWYFILTSFILNSQYNIIALRKGI